ncbi:MAG: glutamate-cysteine ligase family protein [Burkholderiaceae bacterium]
MKTPAIAPRSSDPVQPLRAGARLGLELEMVVANRSSGQSHPVQRYFQSLAALRDARGEPSNVLVLDDRIVGIDGAQGESGLDNGFNLLETAFAPIDGERAGLRGIHDEIVQELSDAQTALAQEDAQIINAAQHPDCAVDDAWYARVRAPRPIYTELVGHRGWRHHLGIDAKAQNSPCTAVGVADAARALNAILALAPACIALFANSPLEGGRVTGLKETRLSLWPRMFSDTRFAGDFMLQQLPARPFKDLGDYFRWMFGPGTATRSLPLAWHQGYKSAARVYLKDDPPLATFLHAATWSARSENGQIATLTPHSAHFEYAQFAHFLDARWRYRLDSLPDLPVLLHAWDEEGGLEALFARHGVDGYIEGRGPGANFADPDLMSQAGETICASVAVAPSAIQLGLMRNLDAALDLVGDWGWSALADLRMPAITQALAHDRVHALAKEVLAVAAAGLSAQDIPWLAYPDYALQTRQTGADRLLDLWQAHETAPATRLAHIGKHRRALAM